MYYLQLLRIYIRQTHTSDSELCLLGKYMHKRVITGSIGKEILHDGMFLGFPTSLWH